MGGANFLKTKQYLKNTNLKVFNNKLTKRKSPNTTGETTMLNCSFNPVRIKSYALATAVVLSRQAWAKCGRNLKH